MYIKKLYVKNFRNIKEASLDFDKNLNIFAGQNAQGKTNLMEAVSVCLGGSFRHSRASQFVPASSPDSEVFIGLSFSDDNNTKRDNIVEYTLSKGGKPNITYNSLKIKDAAELYGVLKYVVFVPEHLTLIKGSPDLRRDYLDSVAVMQTHTHLKKLSRYNKALKQRNNILAAARPDTPLQQLSAALTPWNEILAVEGINVTYGRLKYFRFLKNCAAEIYSALSNNSETLDMSYSSSVFKTESIDFSNLNSLFERYMDVLNSGLNNEMKLRFTVSGVHRDDISFFISGLNAKEFASQGQVRSAALALKLSEAEIIRRKNKTCPVIILDDILSELDSSRRKFVINHIDNSQVFITCCNLQDLSLLNNGKSWIADNGTFSER